MKQVFIAEKTFDRTMLETTDFRNCFNKEKGFKSPTNYLLGATHAEETSA